MAAKYESRSETYARLLKDQTRFDPMYQTQKEKKFPIRQVTDRKAFWTGKDFHPTQEHT